MATCRYNFLDILLLIVNHISLCDGILNKLIF